VSVWRAGSAAGLPVIDARESFAGGAWQLAELSAPISGPVDEPQLAGSGRGDALIAFRQGPPGRAQVMAAVAKGPPGDFEAVTPVGWTRAAHVQLTWSAAPEAFGTTSYDVLIDGRTVQRGLRGLATRLDPRGLGDGVHSVQVLATDGLGQQTMTSVAKLKVDADPPTASVRRLRGGRVRVRVFDRGSGAVARTARIAFGDGTDVARRLRATHRYARPGVYRIVIGCADRVGNRAVLVLRVSVS
jgi:hypothetical protein